MTQPHFDALGLSCDAIGCARGGVPVVRGVSLALGGGEAIELTGRNGAGKSSLLAAIAGRVPLNEGKLVWTQNDEGISARDASSQIAILDHHSAMKPDLSVGENLKFWCRLYAKPLAAILQAAQRSGIEQFLHRKTATLSAGQKRRLSFARILIADRPVWLLDEPTASIDASGKADISDMITAHLALGGLALIATHEPLDVSSQALRLG